MTDEGGHLPHAARTLAGAVDELQKLLVRSRNIGLRYPRDGRQPRTRDRLPRAEDAEGRAVRRLRRADAHREPRRAFPRRLSASQRCAVAEAHARDAGADADALPTARLRSARRRCAWSCRPAGAAMAAKDYIDHPGHAAARGARWRACAKTMADASRIDDPARADALRAPAARALRGRNERIDERLPSDATRTSASARSTKVAARSRSTPPRRSAQLHVPHPALQPAGPGERAAHADVFELEEADGMTLFIALERDPREARPVAAVRLRLPRRHLRQLRDGDQRAARRSPAAR